MVPDRVGLYSIFTFEPLHSLHLEISKSMKECTIGNISSDKVKKPPEKPQYQRITLFSMRNSVQRASDSKLPAIGREYYKF